MAPPKQAYDVMRAIMDSLGTLYLNAQTSKEASAIKREDWNKKVYLTNMDHENSLDRIETTSRLNALSKEIDNLLSRLKKEYNEIAERNLSEGMSPEEEEVYPSRLYSEYGGEPIGNREME